MSEEEKCWQRGKLIGKEGYGRRKCQGNGSWSTSVRGCGRIRKEKEKDFQRAADTRHRSMNEPSEAVEIRHFNGN